MSIALRSRVRGRGLDLLLLCGASLALSALTLYLLQSLGVILFTDRGRSLGRLPGFVYYHLRSSVFFFSGAFAVFALALRSLARRLRDYERDGQLSAILTLDERADMAITTFFGVGVIYTAIGMESALLNALGGIGGAEEAARQGAWEILRKLVDGGLILALSTTIFGGAGGYLLRLLKHAVVGDRLSAVLVAEEQQREALLTQMSEDLRRIRSVLARPHPD